MASRNKIKNRGKNKACKTCGQVFLWQAMVKGCDHQTLDRYKRKAGRKADR